MQNELTVGRIRELLQYDVESGVFTWRVSRPGCRAGAIAGSPDRKGYLRIGLGRRLHFAHRLAWIYVYGEWPATEIDHINRIKTDNRIANLRVVTTSQNQQNTKIRSNNTSGFRGVSFHKQAGRWVAKIILHGKKHHLGLYDTPEQARDVYELAASRMHPHRLNPSRDEVAA